MELIRWLICYQLVFWRQVPEAVYGQIDDEIIAQDDDKEVTYSYDTDFTVQFTVYKVLTISSPTF